jgi:hypothetical protein
MKIFTLVYHEYEGTKPLQNVGSYIPVYMVSYPRSLESLNYFINQQMHTKTTFK